MPELANPVLDGIPSTNCTFAPFGEVLEGEQHLEGLVGGRLALMAKDQRGIARPQGAGCDIGAVEVGKSGTRDDSWPRPCVPRR